MLPMSYVMYVLCLEKQISFMLYFSSTHAPTKVHVHFPFLCSWKLFWHPARSAEVYHFVGEQQYRN